MTTTDHSGDGNVWRNIRRNIFTLFERLTIKASGLDICLVKIKGLTESPKVGLIVTNNIVNTRAVTKGPGTGETKTGMTIVI